jgi:DNA-binding transcriptional regulator YbjK
MTTITIRQESAGKNGLIYRAISGTLQSEGRSAGEALDALTKQLGEAEANTLVIIQQLRPDRFFTATQQQRLSDLMSRWREARDHDSQLTPEEQAELEQLIEAELQATTRRAESALIELEK